MCTGGNILLRGITACVMYVLPAASVDLYVCGVCVFAPSKYIV
eukprot:COSAG01_NODE_25797_length_732_cov_59.000000_2_plen_42_part_01